MTPSKTAKLIGSAPVIFVRNVFAATEHYRDTMGFSFGKVFGEPPSFAILKRDKIVLDWRKEQNTRAAVHVAIAETLDRLPEIFTQSLYTEKCGAVYQHVFDSYWDDGHSVYDRAA